MPFYFEFIIRNIINDYVYELKELSIEVKLTTDEIYKYKYNPKRLAYDVYGSTKLFFIISHIYYYVNYLLLLPFTISSSLKYILLSSNSDTI